MAAKGYIKQRYKWVVDMDIEKFFDKVNHDMLMVIVARKVKDKRVLKLIRAYLNSGVMINGVVVETVKGTHPGGSLSSLLLNIVLDDLDKEPERRDHKLSRYADDCNIYLKSRIATERTHISIRKFIEAKPKIKINTSKSAVDTVWRRKFLGFSYYTSLKGEISIRLALRVAKRQRDKIREITKRNRGRSIDSIIAEINVKMKGFINYFKLADMREFLVERYSLIL